MHFRCSMARANSLLPGLCTQEKNIGFVYMVARAFAVNTSFLHQTLCRRGCQQLAPSQKLAPSLGFPFVYRTTRLNWRDLVWREQPRSLHWTGLSIDQLHKEVQPGTQ